VQLAHLIPIISCALIDLKKLTNFSIGREKDVWEFRWVSDNPELLAVLEKQN
jgi:hypothetical protein